MFTEVNVMIKRIMNYYKERIYRS